MSKYRVTLTIHETAAMSKEDFRKLQEAVNQIAEVTEFKMVIDTEAMKVASVSEMMSQLPKQAFPIMIHKPDSKFAESDWHKNVYGHDLPEDEKALSSHN
jgi:hypothetical protein